MSESQESESSSFEDDTPETLRKDILEAAERKENAHPDTWHQIKDQISARITYLKDNRQLNDNGAAEMRQFAEANLPWLY